MITRILCVDSSERDPDAQVSGIAEDAENAPGSVIARELRRTLGDDSAT